MVLIKEVCKNSPAERAGILPGDKLISINGKAIADVLDYRYYAVERRLSIELMRGAQKFSVELKKREYDDIGLEFETYLMDKKHTCRNKCIFCFIDQNPPGMRETIYFKDDDSRLSFLMGNYITLTNMSDEDIDRIIEMKMSPVNISVHTMNPELRVRMMKNPNAGKVLAYIDRLAGAGISLNFQIVLCRGVNDGAELEYTLSECEKYHEVLLGVSIVPAGVTQYRRGLYPLAEFTEAEAAEVIGTVDAYGARCLEKYGTRLFFCADEFYLKARLPLPEGDYYEGYPQLEDGIGSIRSSADEIDDELANALHNYDIKIPRKLSIATGAAAYDFICESVKKIAKACTDAGGTAPECEVFCIKNYFFGESITVAGLLTGGDIYKQVCGKALGERLLIPDVAIRHEGELFLDDMSRAELEEKLGVPVIPTSGCGADIVGNILFDK